MSTGIEKFQAEEKIRMLFFKHRGDLARVAKETGYDIVLVQKVATKIQNRRKHDIDYNIAAAISTEVLSGHESRIAHVRGIIDRIEEEARTAKSNCCKRPYRIDKFDEQEYYFCTKCNKECTLFQPRENIVEYRKLLKLWCEEDSALALFAEKMGFTFREDSLKIQQNNYLVHQDGKPQENGRKQIQSKVLDTEQQDIITQAEDMDPRTREKLRKELVKKALEAAREGVKKNGD